MVRPWGKSALEMKHTQTAKPKTLIFMAYVASLEGQSCCSNPTAIMLQD